MLAAAMLIVVPSGMRAVVATFMPTVPAIPVLATVKTPVATAMPIVMRAAMPTVVSVVVLGASTTRRADGQQEGAHQRYRHLAVPREDVVHADAPIVCLGGSLVRSTSRALLRVS